MPIRIVGELNINTDNEFRRMTTKRLIYYLLGGIFWAIVVGAGFLCLMQYENTPGKTISMNSLWPRESKVRPNQYKPTLLMFVHPQCPCSKASIAELSELLQWFPNQVKTYILFYQPSDFPVDWDKTALWASAQQIPGVTLLEDWDGQEAKRFRATISGQVLFYNSRQELQFSGGITPARGQMGYSEGQAALKRLISKESLPQLKTPVFGCPIVSWLQRKV